MHTLPPEEEQCSHVAENVDAGVVETGSHNSTTICINDLSYNIHLMMHSLLEFMWHRGTKYTRERISFYSITIHGVPLPYYNAQIKK